MTPEEHRSAIVAATANLHRAVEKAYNELPVGRAGVVVAGIYDLLADLQQEVDELGEVPAW